MPKVPPKERRSKASPSESPQAALEDLLRALAKWAQKVGAPPDYVKQALQDLQSALAEDEPNTPTDSLSRDSTLARSKSRGRHDERRVPAGYVYRGGRLLKLGKPPGSASPSERTEYIARSLLSTLACWFELEGPSDHDNSLAGFLETHGDPVIRARLTGTAAEHAAGLELAYEAIFGEPWGTPPWRRALIGQLEMDARHREEERARRVRGDPDPHDWEHAKKMLGDVGQFGALLRAASGSEIRAVLAKHHELPPELTPQVIENMREQVRINARGRGKKKTAASVVAAFAKELERRRRN